MPMSRKKPVRDNSCEVEEDGGKEGVEGGEEDSGEGEETGITNEED